MTDLTAPDFDAFCKRYAEDDNEWWMTSSGLHQHYFDRALDRIDALTAELAQLRDPQ